MRLSRQLDLVFLNPKNIFNTEFSLLIWNIAPLYGIMRIHLIISWLISQKKKQQQKKHTTQPLYIL